MKIALRGNIQLGAITTSTELFLAIILGNLSHQNPNARSGYSELSRTEKKNLRSVFKLCKENLQRNNEDSAGILKGTKIEDETWQCDETHLEIPLTFLKSVGIFEVHPSDCGQLTLTAQHMSFAEFMAAAGMLLSSNLKSELEKIHSTDRSKAVSVYTRK